MPYSDPDKRRSYDAERQRKRRLRPLSNQLVRDGDQPVLPALAPTVRLRSAADVLSLFEQAHAVLANSGADGITTARTMISLASAAGKVIGDVDIALEFESLKAEFARLKAGEHA